MHGIAMVTASKSSEKATCVGIRVKHDEARQGLMVQSSRRTYYKY